ncbi:3-hydroxyacyl-CoA dehydrogenase [Sphingobium sp. 22B]|nr:3-hydroxyacyl-CoA dehydrogenase [Sphingobium sp. AM]KYC32771.1 3-hydroxyacyl-CoA dehydrogenase [Sphingobium sp. 22B]OAP31688.1 3-hydroxyacyl-CoA dehydrogenase [Sphingobium sp. 20006FA]
MMIEVRDHDGVLELAIDNPPVNALGAQVRRELLSAIEQADADPTIRAVVIRGAGSLFSGGADIREFGQAPVEPMLPALVERIERAGKPVVAAIAGTCLGGGLEVALACHYRIAARSVRLGLPEVKLGLLPGAGGTQRLPRLTGAEAALEMIVSGTPVDAARAAGIGLVDRLTDDDRLAQEALDWARTLDAPCRTGERTVAAEPGLFERFAEERKRALAGRDAPRACIEAVEAATRLPLAEGLAQEQALFARLVEGDQSRALRHVFFAERLAAKIEGVPADLAHRPIRSVGVIGAGTMGGGIAMNFLSTGIPVIMVDMTQEALERGTAIIRGNYEASVRKGRISAADAQAAMGRLSPTLDFAALWECDLLIEAVYEDMAIKTGIFARLDSIAKPGAILASNTSYLSIDEIAAATSRPQDVLGLHFFSPANVMRLVEVVRGRLTAPDALATAMGLARKIGKVPVVAGVCYGFIGNRMLMPRQLQAEALLLEGASPEQIDRVHTGFGMPMGPFQMGDLAGLDIGWHRDPSRIESIRDALCAADRWGQKKLAGFYDYDEKRRPTPSAVTADIVDRFRREAGVQQRAVGEEEIVARTLYVMVNEAARILEEGIAQRASDIDLVWVHGYGWPPTRGGPVYWADRIGLDRIVQGLRSYMAQDPDFVLSPLLAARAAEGRPLSE